MPQILTNETNLDSLKDAISKAKENIYIISAWIRSETLKKIFTDKVIANIKKQGVSVCIVIRLSSIDDLQITDEGVFHFADELGENCKIRYNKHLHTKLYVVDNFYVSVGSYNLTGGGFGDNVKKGSNVETGIEITNTKEVKELLERAEEIWDESFDIPDDLLGFTLNETTHYSFTVAGIKPLENGKFVEIREHENEIILGQIGEVKKYNFSFYSSPDAGDYNEELIDTFSNSAALLNKLKGMAVSSNLSQGQLNIAQVQIVGRFYIKRNKNDDIKNIIKDDNKIAPDVGKEVYIASKEVLEHLFLNRFCKPAVLNSNREVRVGLNPDEILSKHMAVFGSTGSGKSYFVKYMISEFLYDYIVKKLKGRIIIFDPHGEYAKDLSKNVLSKNKIIDFKKCSKYLIQYILELDDFLDYFNIKRNTKLAGIIEGIYNSSKNLNNNNIIKILKKNKGDGKVLKDSLINSINDELKNKIISFDLPQDLWKDFKTPDIYCINLEDSTELEDMWTIAGNIMTDIFNHAKSNKKFPTLFIVEEAHNFAPEGEGKNNPAAKAMKQIAREGRKFNVGMVVVTQRPAYVSKDVLSQCSTQAIFRLINSNDIGQVADVVEGIGREELIRLPHYVQGQAVFTGVAIQSPVVVKVGV